MYTIGRIQSKGQEKKYGNKKVQYNGISFDSEKEYKRYLVLLDAQNRGIISNLECHPKYELIPKMSHTETTEVQLKTKTKIVTKEVCDQLPITYTADFRYNKGDNIIVEDVKASAYMIPKEFELKKKLLYWRLGVKIRLVFKATEEV